MRYSGNRDSQHVIASHETYVAADCQIIHANVPDVSRDNPLDREIQLTSVSYPKDKRQRETRATPPIGSREEMETYKNIEGAVNRESEGNLTPETSEIANVSASSTNSAVDSSRNDPDEATASTSKWETTPASSSKGSRQNRTASRTPICATAMKFLRKRSAVVSKKIIAPVLKRRKSIKGELSVIAAAITTRDSGVKITQIEQSTVQIARGGNKRRTYVNIQMQTADAIVGRILSEFLVNGGKKKKQVLMSITLQSDSDQDVSDRKESSSREAETQTTSNNGSSTTSTDTFDYPCSPTAIVATAKIVPCFVCDKRDCYEIKRSDESITLEDALIAEYPEPPELPDYIAKRRTDMEISP